MKILLSIRPEFADKIFSGTKIYEYRRKIWKRKDVSKAMVYATAPIGKVIGEFEVMQTARGLIPNIWELTGRKGGISKAAFYKYFEGLEEGYVITIKNPVLYKVPHHLPFSRPPQNFMYIGENIK